MIHFRNEEIQIRAHGSVQTPFMGTACDWRDVTCGLCRLEEPLTPRAEYQVPADVLGRDAALSRADRLRVQRSLAEAVEREALRMIAEYRAVHSDARALSDRLTGLIETERLREASARGPEGSEPAETLTGAVRVGDGVSLPAPYGQGRQYKVEMVRDGMIAVVLGGQYKWFAEGKVTGVKMSAPVSAVDIRTESEENRDMPQMTNLSEDAVKALLSAPGNKIGAKVSGVHVIVWQELYVANLIGANGGLTRKGSIERERRSEASAKALFGED